MKPRELSETAAAETLDARAPASTREGADPSRLVAGRYEILGLVGSGGMGTVYRARDRELEETVALKMLKKRLASSEQALARFRREVKLARRVTHRNVARTFDIGEHAGGKFLTMEFIDGEMLRAVLGAARQMSIAEAVRIGREVSTGLAAAHAAGVLHRDLKPENVIVARAKDPNERRAVITDFGIARALSQGDAAKSAGDVVGTPAYMAPEQLENATLDERTDIYALGVMLFELLTGAVPWGSDSPIKAALARLREGPPNPRTLRTSIPSELSEIVVRCMARQPSDRFASAAEVAEALARVGATTPSAASSSGAFGALPPSSAAALAPTPRAARATVAVLPLVHQGDPAVAYVAESITDDLVELLESVPEVLVVHAPQASLEPRATGRALGVHAVVTGTFHYVAARLDVSLSLITVEDGFEIWSQRFERVAADVATIADDAARGIADALSTRLTHASSIRGLPTDPVAYDLFLRGRSVFMRGWYDASGEAIRLLGEAYARAPDNAIFAAAHARALARAYGVDNSGGDAHAAQRVAERALALDPGRAEARVALALVNLYRGDAVGAASELARALAAAPSDPDVLELVGRLRAEVGPLPVAIGQLEAVLAREPSFAEARYTLARGRALEGLWPDVDALLAIDPVEVGHRVPLLLTRARLLVWRGDRTRSAAYVKDVEPLIPTLTDREAQILEIFVAALCGPLTPDERLRLAVLFPTGASTPQRRAAFNAQIRTELLMASRDPDAALESLREADANGLLDLEWLDHCPLLEPIREAPTFEAVRRATGLRAARVRDVLDRA